MQRHFQFISSLVARGGPTPEEYDAVHHWLERVADDIQADPEQRAEFDAGLAQFGHVFEASTMQGFARSKPHGYAGDFEVIDRIYRRHLTVDPQLANWDRFF